MLPLYQQKLAQLNEVKTEFLNIVRQATPEQRRFKPTPESWCMLEVLEHIVVSESGAVRFMKKRGTLPSSAFNRFKGKFRAALLMAFMRSSFKVKAPKGVPGLVPKEITPLEELLPMWDVQKDELVDYLDNFSPEHQHHFVFKHPLSGKLTLAQTLDFFREHIVHHLSQLKRIRASANFPVANTVNK